MVLPVNWLSKPSVRTLGLLFIYYLLIGEFIDWLIFIYLFLLLCASWGEGNYELILYLKARPTWHMAFLVGFTFQQAGIIVSIIHT